MSNTAIKGPVSAPAATAAPKAKRERKPSDVELVAIRRVGSATSGLTDSQKRRVLAYHSARCAVEQ